MGRCTRRHRSCTSNRPGTTGRIFRSSRCRCWCQRTWFRTPGFPSGKRMSRPDSWCRRCRRDRTPRSSHCWWSGSRMIRCTAPAPRSGSRSRTEIRPRLQRPRRRPRLRMPVRTWALRRRTRRHRRRNSPPSPGWSYTLGRRCHSPDIQSRSHRCIDPTRTMPFRSPRAGAVCSRSRIRRSCARPS
jgi:hypothetical protein